jgi:hypothetical protein
MDFAMGERVAAPSSCKLHPSAKLRTLSTTPRFIRSGFLAFSFLTPPFSMFSRSLFFCCSFSRFACSAFSSVDRKTGGGDGGEVGTGGLQAS